MQKPAPNKTVPLPILSASPLATSPHQILNNVKSFIFFTPIVTQSKNFASK